MIAVMCVPKIMTYAVFVLAAIVLIICGVMILAKPINIFHPSYWDLVLAICLLVFAVALLIFLCCYNS